ncbi:MAG: universal stress protein, partial [Pseudomonadaceae bacterium]|nr:universal stress protein [Pseudomonadaceae bacterium]
MLRSILYATDLGLYAPYVLQHALALTRAFRAELHVVHAVEPMGLFAESVLQTYLDEGRLQELRSK